MGVIMSRKDFTKDQLIDALKETEGHCANAAKALGIDRTTFRDKCREMGVEHTDFGGPHRGKVEETLLRRVAKLQKEVGVLRDYESYKANPPKWTIPKRSSKSHRIDTAPYSDSHFTEVVDPGEVEWINAYNTEIGIKRTEVWADHTIRLARDYSAGTTCDGLIMPLLGDIQSGIIHDELAKTNDQAVLQGCFTAADTICAAINLFAEYYGKVFVPCVIGNHGRLTPKVSYKGAVQDNFDWLIYNLIARYFHADKRVTVHVSDAQEYDYKAYGTTYRITHGQEFRGGSGIIGSLYPTLRGNKRKRERQSVIGRPYDYLILGHFHKAVQAVDGVIMNGAIKGYDEYAYNGNMIPTPPEQVWFTTDPEHGLAISAKVRCIPSAGEAWMEAAPEDATPDWMLTK